MKTGTRFKIAVLPGDGIGPEVIREGVKVLRAVERKLKAVVFDLTEFSVGAGEYLRNGDPLPTSTFTQLHNYTAILLGAMGLPDIRWPEGVEMTPQIDLRERLDLYCGLRPIYLYHSDDCPLKSYDSGEIDFLIVRESTEGLFSGRLKRSPLEVEEATDLMRISRRGSERLFHAAFREASKRRGQLTLIDKANVLPSMAYFRKIFEKISQQYPNVRTEKIYVDAASLYFVTRPHTFDVVVTENMFGDILSDLAAGLVGGMGMAPSADVGECYAVFQPSHGSAPDIAGKGVANPTATILSVAMMLDWLKHPQTILGAQLVRQAVKTVLSVAKNRTPDLRGSLSTSEMGDLIAGAIALK